MPNEFKIEIAPNGAQLRFTVSRTQPGMPAAGMVFHRQPPNLAGDLAGKLRIGKATPAEVQQVTAQISQWALSNDIDPLLYNELVTPGNEPFRLIFSVNDPQLSETLSEIPFELCQVANTGLPLALHGKNASILYLLPKVGTTSALAAGTWPLRILIVRSNPQDLGGAVPSADQLRQSIYASLDAAVGLSRKLVQVHVLSSEAAPDLAGRPTREGFRTQLYKATYDILVYLGHGDVLPAYLGLAPVGVLQLETEDGAAHVTVPADQLAVLLHDRPVPVVLLVGCLTAGDLPADAQSAVEALTPQWMRGSQGLAQALVNSGSGVQLAVGMRYMLETKDAMDFLTVFFGSLLNNGEARKRGDVEAAVHAARVAMQYGTPGSYSWSAPMIFRAPGQEPLFPFLASPPANVCPAVQQHQDLRDMIWRSLVKYSWSLRAQGGAAPIHDMLQAVEQQLVQAVLAKAPTLIMPDLVVARHEETVTVPVGLHGAMNVEALRGKLVVGGEHVKVTRLQATPELRAGGFDVLSAVEGNRASFRIDHDGNGGALAAGPLFHATVELDSATQIVYPVTVDITEARPAQPVCSSLNAIIVPAP